MTGFGRSERLTPLGPVRVELKSTNHKFLDVSSRLPGYLAEFEDAIRKKISDTLSRGKVHVFVQAPDPSVFASRIRPNERLAGEAAKAILSLRAKLGAEKTVSAADVFREVLRVPDVLVRESAPASRNQYSKELLAAVADALVSLERSRAAEGSVLAADLKKHLGLMRRALAVIARQARSTGARYRKSLQSRMSEFLQDGQLDKERLTLEVAQYVKNADISEEISRLGGHFDALDRAIREGGELGRKIDFIAQEMIRETNTIGSKSADAAITQQVIELKGAIEKIREQAQNAE
jgi:uncharacterized protein (TIGR00255 family)